MITMVRRASAFAAMLALAVTLGCARAESPSAQPSLPKSILGKWKVESVLINRESGRTITYQLDDPALMGDTFLIDGQKIETTTPEARKCSNPGTIAWKTSAKKLFETTVAPTPPNTPATVAGYHFPSSPSAAIEVLFVKCATGHFGPAPIDSALDAIGDDNAETWIVALPSGKLAVLWYDDTILLLTRA